MQYLEMFHESRRPEMREATTQFLLALSRLDSPSLDRIAKAGGLDAYFYKAAQNEDLAPLPLIIATDTQGILGPHYFTFERYGEAPVRVLADDLAEAHKELDRVTEDNGIFWTLTKKERV